MKISNIELKNNYYDLYDENGKKYKSLFNGSNNTIGTFISISGNSITFRRGSYIDTYDSTGKKLNSRFSN